MANLSNINNKFLFTDGDFLKIGNLAPINNISGTESGISITNSNVASITLDNTAASGKRYIMYSSGNGSLVFWDGDAASARLQIDSAGNSTFAGDVETSLGFIANSNHGYQLGNTGATLIGNWYNSSGVNYLQGGTSRSWKIGSVTNGLNTYFDSINNRVGIGTDSPIGKLQITGIGSDVLGNGLNLTTSDYSRGATKAGTSMVSFFGADTGNTYGAMQVWNTGVTAYGDLALQPQGGNVGIGTTAPVSTWLNTFDPTTGNGTFKLTSEGWIVTPYLTGLAAYYPGQGARPIFWSDVNGTNIQSWDNDAADAISLRSSNGSIKLIVKEGGNVGINETNPGSKLQINTSDERVTMLNSTVADQLIYSQINANSSTASTITAAAAIELVGQANASGHGRHAWIGAEGTSNTTFETKLKFKLRGETASGYDWAGSAEAPTIMTLEGSGNVGIGTVSPMTKLHIQSGNGSYPDDANNHLVVESSSHSYIGLGGGTSSDVGIHFGDSGGIAQGRIAYKNSDNSMRFMANLSERLTILSSGNVGIGTTSPTTKFQVIDGFFQHSASKIHAASVNLFSVKFSAGTSTCKGAITVTITGSRYSPGNNDYAGGAVYHLVRNNVANLVTYTQYTFGTWQPVIDTNNTTKTWTFSSAYFGIPNNNTVYSVTIQGAGHQVTTVTNPVVTIL